MNINLKAGDKVRLNWSADQSYVVGATTGVVIDHPTQASWVIVVSDDVDDGASAFVYNRNGTQPSTDFVDVTPIDPLRESWDAVNETVREHIKWLMAGGHSDPWSDARSFQPQKIRAIKLLRAVSGLGLTEAKLAVETFGI